MKITALALAVAAVACSHDKPKAEKTTPVAKDDTPAPTKQQTPPSQRRKAFCKS